MHVWLDKGYTSSSRKWKLWTFNVQRLQMWENSLKTFWYIRIFKWRGLNSAYTRALISGVKTILLRAVFMNIKWIFGVEMREKVSPISSKTWRPLLMLLEIWNFVCLNFFLKKYARMGTPWRLICCLLNGHWPKISLTYYNKIKTTSIYFLFY